MRDELLYGWRTGALDPPDALRVEEAIRTDPLLMARAMALPDSQPTAPDPLRIPPQGWGLSSRVLQAEVFGGRLRPGDRFRISLEPRDHTERAVVVLRQREEWEVVFPVREGQVLALSSLPVESGRPILDLTADREVGRQIWAVALPDLQRLQSGLPQVRTGLAMGEVPVTRFEVRVG